MKSRVTPHLIELTFEAALRSFWRKGKLVSFLRSSAVSGLPEFGPDETKRDYIERVFGLLKNTDEGRGKILQIANHLAEQKSFPDLNGWEDTADKLELAKGAVGALRSYLAEQEEELASDKRRSESRATMQEAQRKARQAQQTLKTLTDELAEIAAEIGTQKAGKDFEKWFYRLMDYSEIVARLPYRTKGREIDGTITIGDTTYLVECKFTEGKTASTDIDIFRRKVDRKADNTMGVVVGVSGYTSCAVDAASGDKTPLLLLDHAHIYGVLGGVYTFKNVVERVRRHCSQTGEPYLPMDKFSG